MDVILATLKDLGLWAGILAVFFAYWLFVLGGLHEKANADARGRWVATLRRGDWKSHYERRVLGVLGRIDRVLTPEAFGDAPIPDSTGLRTAFSFNLLNITLLLALLYPTFSLLAHWAITGADGAIGGLIVIPAEPRGWARFATICGILSSIVCFTGSVKAAQQGRTGYALSGLFAGVAFAFAVAGAGAGAFAFAVAFAVTFAGAVAVAGVGGGAFAGEGAFVVAVAGGGAVAGASAFAVSVAGVGGGAFADALAFAGAVAGAFLQAVMGERTGRPGVALFVYAVAILLAVCAAVMVSPSFPIISSGEDPRGIILFIAILPLLNGIADFASVGATRWLIRRSGANPLAWIFDAVIAAFILTALAFAFIAIVVFVVPGDGRPLIDLPALFQGLRDTPEDYWWLSFMLFSTLLPTAIHLIVALSSVMTITPKSWRLYIADEIEAGGKGDWARGRHGKLLLALLNAIAMWWPTCFVVYGGLWVWTGENGLRDMLIWLAEWWAGVLGVHIFPFVAL